MDLNCWNMEQDIWCGILPLNIMKNSLQSSKLPWFGSLKQMEQSFSPNKLGNLKKVTFTNYWNYHNMMPFSWTNPKSPCSKNAWCELNRSDILQKLNRYLCWLQKRVEIPSIKQTKGICFTCNWIKNFIILIFQTAVTVYLTLKRWMTMNVIKVNKNHNPFS